MVEILDSISYTGLNQSRIEKLKELTETIEDNSQELSALSQIPLKERNAQFERDELRVLSSLAKDQMTLRQTALKIDQIRDIIMDNLSDHKPSWELLDQLIRKLIGKNVERFTVDKFAGGKR